MQSQTRPDLQSRLNTFSPFCHDESIPIQSHIDWIFFQTLLLLKHIDYNIQPRKHTHLFHPNM